MNSMVEKVGRALGEEETNRIIALYGAIADADLAGGAPINQSNAALNWAGLNKLHNTLRAENWKATVLAVNETQLHQLLNDDKFIHAQYLPSGQTDLDQATVASVLGMRVQASTLVPNGTAYALRHPCCLRNASTSRRKCGRLGRHQKRQIRRQSNHTLRHRRSEKQSHR